MLFLISIFPPFYFILTQPCVEDRMRTKCEHIALSGNVGWGCWSVNLSVKFNKERDRTANISFKHSGEILHS